MNPAILATGHYSIRRLPAEVVERTIGKTALHVLRMLWAWRDPETGLVTVQRWRLAETRGFAPVSEQAVMRALLLLVKVGFVQNIGWREARAANGRRIPVFARRVYGGDAPPKLLGERHVLAVPEPVAAWIARAPADHDRGGGRGRGGAPKGNQNRKDGDGSVYRPEAARKRTLRRLEDIRAGRVKIDSEAAQLEAEDRRERSRKCAKAQSSRINGSGRPPSMDRVALRSLDPDPLVGLSQKKDRAPEAGAQISPPPAVERKDINEINLDAKPTEAAPIRTSDRVLRCGSNSARAIPIRGLPPYPTIRTATIPNPPKISETATDEEAAHALAQAYRGAFEARTKQPCWAARLPQVVKNKKAWSLLLEVGAMLRDAGVPPAGWVAWSFDVWKSLGHTSKPPSIAWTFSTKRIGGDLGWYNDEGYDEIGGLLISGPIEKDFARRFMSMQEVANCGRGGSAEALVAHYFPEGYAQALQATHAEAARLREEVTRRLVDGVWLWGA